MEIRTLTLEEVFNLSGDLYPLTRSNLGMRSEEERKRIQYIGLEETSLNGEGIDPIILGILGLEPYVFDKEPCYYLSLLEILSSQRHKGFGTLLMHFICDMKKSILLTCDYSLIGFYEKFGFKVTEFIEDWQKFLMFRSKLSI